MLRFCGAKRDIMSEGIAESPSMAPKYRMVVAPAHFESFKSTGQGLGFRV